MHSITEISNYLKKQADSAASDAHWGLAGIPREMLERKAEIAKDASDAFDKAYASRIEVPW